LPHTTICLARDVNLGAAFELTIRDLAAMVAKACRFEGELAWDTSKPNGAAANARHLEGAARVRLEGADPVRGGLRETVEWFERNRGKIQ
jgi:GDP-L-fucose synthase